MSDPKCQEAKWIDPATLRLGAEPARPTQNGNLAASLKYVSGISGDSLIVGFNRSAIKDGQPLIMEGKTHSGMPVRGTANP